MARLQDFASITPTSSDSVLGVQSAGQGLIGIDTALSSSTSKIPTSAAVKNAMNVYVDTSVSNRVHITLPTYVDDEVHGVSLKLYDTSDNERTRLTTDGLSFYNASGTQTAKYPLKMTRTVYTASNASLTFSTAQVIFFDYGMWGLIFLNLNLTSTLGAGTYYDICTLDRTPYEAILQMVPNTDGTSAVMVRVVDTGKVQLYRYSAAAAFTGWIRTTMIIPLSVT